MWRRGVCAYDAIRARGHVPPEGISLLRKGNTTYDVILTGNRQQQQTRDLSSSTFKKDLMLRRSALRNSRGDQFDLLPEEVWAEIFAYLEYQELCHVARVSESVFRTTFI